MKMRRIGFFLLTVAWLAEIPVLARAQSLADSMDSSAWAACTLPAHGAPDPGSNP
jgi:hypothetical protein